jgi:hypothetical protein
MDSSIIGNDPDRPFQLLGNPVCRGALQIAQVAVEGRSRDEDKLRIRVLPQGLHAGLDKVVDHQEPRGDDIASIGLITDRCDRVDIPGNVAWLVDLPTDSFMGGFRGQPENLAVGSKSVLGISSQGCRQDRIDVDIKLPAHMGKNGNGDAMPVPHALGKIRKLPEGTFHRPDRIGR